MIDNGKAMEVASEVVNVIGEVDAETFLEVAVDVAVAPAEPDVSAGEAFSEAVPDVEANASPVTPKAAEA